MDLKNVRHLREILVTDAGQGDQHDAIFIPERLSLPTEFRGGSA